MLGQSILLIGASGLVGNEILKLLYRDKYYQEIVLLNRRKLTEYTDDPRIRQIIVDFDRLEDYKNSIKALTIVSTLGTTIKKAGSRENFKKIDYTYTLKVAEIAKRNGAEHFILVTSIGADPKSKIFYNRIKGEVEKTASDLGFRTLSIFRPSILLGKRKEFRLGEVIGKTFMSIFSFALPKKYEPTEAHQLAETILYVARRPEPGIKIYKADHIQDLYYEQL